MGYGFFFSKGVHGVSVVAVVVVVKPCLLSFGLTASLFSVHARMHPLPVVPLSKLTS